MVYHNEIFTNIEKGDKLKGYIKQIRNDEKIDVSLQPFGYEKIDALSQQISTCLKIMTIICLYLTNLRQKLSIITFLVVKKISKKQLELYIENT